MKTFKKFRFLIYVALPIGVLLFSPAALLAQEAAGASEVALAEPSRPPLKGAAVTPAAAQTVSVDVKDVPIRDLVDFLSRRTRSNIIVKRGVEGNVTLRMTNAPWQAVLEEAAEQIGCIVEEEEGLFYVSKPPRVTITFTDAPLKKAISTIAKLSGANIIVSQDVTGVVSARLVDVPWKEALQKIVETAGFVIVKEKYGIYRVVSSDVLKRQLVTRVFNLRYVQPPDAYIAKIDTKYAVGGPEAQQATTTLAVSGAGARGRGGAQTAGGVLTQFPLLNALANVLSPYGSIQYDRFSNSFIVQDIKPKIDEIANIIASVDIEPLQVFIDVKFVTTQNTDLLNFGVDYGELGAQITATGATVSIELPFALRRQLVSPGVWDFSTVAPILSMLKKDETTRIQQAPKLVTLDNHQATIFVGETIRFAETFAATNQAGGVQTGIREADNSPVDTGFQLLITPHIIRGTDQVIVQVIPADQSLSGPDEGFDVFQSAGETIRLPRVRSRTVVTKLIMKSGQVAVLGGMMDERSTEGISKWPFVGDIPVVGWVFKSQVRNRRRNNLIIFMRVVVLHSSQEVDEFYSYASGADWRVEFPGESEQERKVWKDIDTIHEKMRKEAPAAEVYEKGAPAKEVPEMEKPSLAVPEGPVVEEVVPPAPKEETAPGEEVAPEVIELPEKPVPPAEEVSPPEAGAEEAAPAPSEEELVPPEQAAPEGEEAPIEKAKPEESPEVSPPAGEEKPSGEEIAPAYDYEVPQGEEETPSE